MGREETFAIEFILLEAFRTKDFERLSALVPSDGVDLPENKWTLETVQ